MGNTREQAAIEAEVDRRLAVVKRNDPTLTRPQAVAKVLDEDPSLYNRWRDARVGAAADGRSLRSAVHSAIHKTAIANRFQGEELGDAIVRTLRENPQLADAYAGCSDRRAGLDVADALDAIEKACPPGEAFQVRTTLRKVLGIGAPTNTERRQAIHKIIGDGDEVMRFR